MNTRLFLGSMGACFATSSLFAVYAPIPEIEKGEVMTVSVYAGAYYDDNIFGSSANEQESFVTDLSYDLIFNVQPTDQMHLRAKYTGQYLIFDDRPGDDVLNNHTIDASMDYSFSEKLSMQVSDTISWIDNPDSSLSTTTLQTDQSSFNNVFYISATWKFTEQVNLVNKYRNSVFNYDAAALAIQLDRVEHLYGLELNYVMNPKLTWVGEYRHQINDYDDETTLKDNSSNFLLVGTNYAMREDLLVQARVGAEARDRDAGSNSTDPFVTVTGRYSYAERSYISSALTYRLKESSDTATFLDNESLDFVTNIQHYISDRIALGGSLGLETATLEGRPGNADVDEDTVRFGINASWIPDLNWTVTVSFDHDSVSSDSAVREETRNRLAASVRYTF